MKILVTGRNEFTGADLVIGKYYYAEPADTGTGEQNRAFHGLLQCYFTSGLHSYPAKSFEDFRNHIKKNLGAGFGSYVYIQDTGSGLEKGKAKAKAEVPENLAVDKCGKKMLYGILKSWADYTKKERTETIDRLIAEMIQAGVDSRKFHEILDGMERNSMEKLAG
jgi:hypothetical protein